MGKRGKEHAVVPLTLFSFDPFPLFIDLDWNPWRTEN
jgi:hypothetical protein